jgi:hypothetical protein
VHLGRGKRFAAEPVVVTDEPMLLFLSDAIRKNPDQARTLEDIRTRMRVK